MQNVVVVWGAREEKEDGEYEDEDNVDGRRDGEVVEVRRVSVSRVTLEDESAPGVSSSSALRMLNANHGRDKK